MLRTLQRRLPPSLLSSTLRRPAFVPVTRAHFSSSRKPFAVSSSDAAKAPSSADQFANGNNAYYAEQMYSLWREVRRFLPGPARGGATLCPGVTERARQDVARGS